MGLLHCSVNGETECFQNISTSLKPISLRYCISSFNIEGLDNIIVVKELPYGKVLLYRLNSVAGFTGIIHCINSPVFLLIYSHLKNLIAKPKQTAVIEDNTTMGIQYCHIGPPIQVP